jgi:ornithine--oxo-acid transaminase
MISSKEIIDITERYVAPNYSPLRVVLSKGEGVWVWDVEGKKYLDMLSCYSALNQGHRHPKIIQALIDQTQRITAVPRAFYHDQMGVFLKELCEFCEMEMALPMNTGAEAVETALKTARKWGYIKKGVPENKAEIIACANNFHGRTISIISFSTEKSYKQNFGPFTPGFKIIPFNNPKALEEAITENTVAFLVEPIQGEGGVIVPKDGYLKEIRRICDTKNILLLVDEIQTGLGRTGEKFACDHEQVKPDILIVGKALGGGVLPVSAILSSKEILSLYKPGEHGSTFGGYPLASAVARASIKVLKEERLEMQAKEMGHYFMSQLRQIKSSNIAEIRGKGLLIAIELKSQEAREVCQRLMEQGILCKETHHNIIRFAPPLIIKKQEIDWALERIKGVFS